MKHPFEIPQTFSTWRMNHTLFMQNIMLTAAQCFLTDDKFRVYGGCGKNETSITHFSLLIYQFHYCGMDSQISIRSLPHSYFWRWQLKMQILIRTAGKNFLKGETMFCILDNFCTLNLKLNGCM